jgi:nucleoid DNA-binding protein
MTKQDLIEAVAQQYPRFSRREAEVMVNVVFDSMAEALGDFRKRISPITREKLGG